MTIKLPKKGERASWIREFEVDGNVDKYNIQPAPQTAPAQPNSVNTSQGNLNGFIYVPSINLYVAKERTLQGKNWNDCQTRLHANGERMPTIPEFTEFLKYLRANSSGVKDASQSEVTTILDDILTVRSPYRAEWLDADFKVYKNGLNVNYYVFENGSIAQKTEQLEDCLMKDKTPGIDLDSWLNNTTKQGLPKANVADGTIWYWFPRSDNNSVAGFIGNAVRAVLICDWYPTDTNPSLGVRAIRRGSP